MRYRCLIYDENRRLDTGLRRLFGALEVTLAEEPDREPAPPHGGEPRDETCGAACGRSGPPASRMW